MPYLGAPFFAEGSAEGLFEAMETVMALHPRLLIHGHAGLTATYTIADRRATTLTRARGPASQRVWVQDGRCSVEWLVAVLTVTTRQWKVGGCGVTSPGGSGCA